MSYSVFVFYVSSPRTREQLVAQVLADDELDAYPDAEPGDEHVEAPSFEASPKIGRFLQDLNSRYPTAEQAARMPEADRWQCPWAGSMDVTDGTVEIPMDGGTPDEAYEFVIELATKHGLVCVGPVDGDLIHAPANLLIGPPLKSKPWWLFWR